MTDQEIERIKKWFLDLIKRALGKKIFLNPRIKALICELLVCLACIIGSNSKELLSELERLIDAIIKELKRQRLISQAPIDKKTETEPRDPNHPRPKKQGGKKSR